MLLVKNRSLTIPVFVCAAGLCVAVAGKAQHASPSHKPAQSMVPLARVTPPPGVANGKSSGQSEAHFTGENLTYDASTGVLHGRNMRFHFPDGDRTVFGETGSYNDHTKIIDAEGHILIEDPKHRVTGDKAHVDNGKPKLAIISSNVVAVIKPGQPAGGSAAASGDKEDVGAARQHGATITCDRLEDYFRKNYIVMRGHFTGKQNYRDKDGKEIERTLTAEHAEYDGKKEILQLFPPVDMHDNQGEQLHFDSMVTVGTREGAETVQSSGAFKGILHYENTSEEEGSEPGPPPPKEGNSGSTPQPPGKP